MADQNIIRPGVRTSITADPATLKQDVDEKVRRLSPEATPMLLLTEAIGKGKRPRSHKVVTMEYDSFDHFDVATNAAAGSAGEERFARITMTGQGRLGSIPVYHPQDKIYVVSTGQILEVTHTASAAVRYGAAEFAVTAGLTGNTTTRTAGRDLVVRNIEPYPVLAFDSSDVIFLGRTLHESQVIEAQPHHRDVVWDCNYLEHKEKVLAFSQDAKEIIETTGRVDFSFQQEEAIAEFKKDVEYTTFFGERAENFDVAGRPTRHMRGLIPSIRTNVTQYNPDSVTDFEKMFSSFLLEQGFRYNPNGPRKIAWAGARFLHQFSLAFREYRNTEMKNGSYMPGLNISSYNILGMEIAIARNEVFRLGTSLDHWCVVHDPLEAELRVVKNFESRPYARPDERDFKMMLEWQGTISWHREASSALLRT